MAQTALQKSVTITEGDASLRLHTLDGGQGKLPQLRSIVEVDRTKPLPTSLQSDFIPDDVLFALTQPPPARDKLGPPSMARNLAVSQRVARPAPAGVWHHKRREKFKHLLDATTCSCGAGKDVSFLYDVHQEYSHPEKPDSLDISSMRKSEESLTKKILHLPDTLIPDEYHLVKNKGVMGIEYHEDKYTTNPEDHAKHLTIFPSMKPTSRFEVIQLQKTMDDLLDKVGFKDSEDEVKGPTQMHNLLELIKKEQNIYNIIFHELIRQTSVECAERGKLLADLRQKYSELLSRVPAQIMSLHEEVMAQRALDRRLTDELLRFKNTIAYLTSELSEVKEHDRAVTSEAYKTQEDLRQALSEAQKNAALLSEYHDLYELQRLRLERQVFVLSEEKEIWSTAAYSLALKVTEEYQLTTAKRLHVSEKAWVKLANHFTILLNDCDTDLLTKIQGHVEKWRDKIEDFNITLRQREEAMKEHLRSAHKHVAKFSEDFKSYCFNKDGNFIRQPDVKKMSSIHDVLHGWEMILNSEVEIFTGDVLLNNQDELTSIRKEMEGWSDSALTVFSRHRGTTGNVHPEQLAMIKLNEEVEKLLEQFQLRISGENGVAANVIQLVNSIESWGTRIMSALNGTITIPDSDWASLYHLLEDWLVAFEQAELYVGSTQTEEARQEGRPHVSLDIHEIVHKTQKWATSASNAIDTEDGKLVDQVGTFHSSMVQWMVQALLRLAPNKEGNSQQAAEMVLMGSISVPQLFEDAKQLFESLHTFSEYVTLCCDGLVSNHVKELEMEEQRMESELRDLQKLRLECAEWTRTAQLLLSDLMGTPVEELFPLNTTQLQTPVPGLSATSLPKSVNSLPSDDVESMKERSSSSEKEKSVSTEPDADQGSSKEKLVSTEPDADQGSSKEKSVSTEPDADQGNSKEKSSSSELNIEKENAEDDPLRQQTLLESDQKPESNQKPESYQKPVSAISESAPTIPKSGKISTMISSLVPTGTLQMEVLGGDENTHRTFLAANISSLIKEIIRESDPTVMKTLALAITPVTTPGVPDTKKAFEALAAVTALQEQLLFTEQRAQKAEERLSLAEHELANAQDLLRRLQKELRVSDVADTTSVADHDSQLQAQTPLSERSHISRQSSLEVGTPTTKDRESSKKKDAKTKAQTKPKKK